jgi:hypothetical protein
MMVLNQPVKFGIAGRFADNAKPSRPNTAAKRDPATIRRGPVGKFVSIVMVSSTTFCAQQGARVLALSQASFGHPSLT